MSNILVYISVDEVCRALMVYSIFSASLHLDWKQGLTAASLKTIWHYDSLPNNLVFLQYVSGFLNLCKHRNVKGSILYLAVIS